MDIIGEYLHKDIAIAIKELSESYNNQKKEIEKLTQTLYSFNSTHIPIEKSVNTEALNTQLLQKLEFNHNAIMEANKQLNIDEIDLINDKNPNVEKVKELTKKYQKYLEQVDVAIQLKCDIKINEHRISYETLKKKFDELLGERSKEISEDITRNDITRNNYTNLEKKLKEITHEYEEAKHNSKLIEKKYENMKIEFNDKKKENNGIMNQLKIVTKFNDELRNRNAIFEKNLSEKTHEVETLKETISENTIKINELKNGVQDMREEFQIEVNKRIDDFKKNHQDELEKSQTLISGYISQINEYKIIVEDLKKKAVTDKHSISYQSGAIKKLESQVKEAVKSGYII